MVFTLPFTIYGHELAAIAALLVLACLLSARTLLKKAALRRCAADCAGIRQEGETARQLPPVSVIVYTRSCDLEEAERNLPLIMEQDYPAPFEVIAVNIDESEEIDSALTRMAIDHPTLRATFIPGSSANVSKKKLAITLGVKAAANDIVLVTAANCRPRSDRWLASMTRHFDDTTGLVIGYSHNLPESDRAFGHRYRSFDTVTEAADYLSAALRGHTFRGNGNNIAYKKELFFANKGFSSSLNLKYGDDDIFISEIARMCDTAVEISPESILEESHQDYPYRFKIEKRRRAFTAKFVRSGHFATSALATAAYYAFLLLTAAAIAYGAYLAAVAGIPAKGAAIAGAGAALYLAETLIHIFAYRKAAAALSSPRLFFTLPLFRFVRPIINACHNSKSAQAGNYTWE